MLCYVPNRYLMYRADKAIVKHTKSVSCHYEKNILRLRYDKQRFTSLFFCAL